ncbi:hypothetical protein VTO42DRAFT_5440 [Malbranchea cinnamomea]
MTSPEQTGTTPGVRRVLIWEVAEPALPYRVITLDDRRKLPNVIMTSSHGKAPRFARFLPEAWHQKVSTALPILCWRPSFPSTSAFDEPKVMGVVWVADIISSTPPPATGSPAGLSATHPAFPPAPSRAAFTAGSCRFSTQFARS